MVAEIIYGFHFWGTNPTSLKFYMGDFFPITHFYKMVWPRNQTKAQWMAALQNLESTDITWKTLWMPRESMLYDCGDNLWVPLLGVWGAISYALLLVRRQYLSTQFFPTTHGLNLLEFDYGTAGYVGRIVELAKAWKESHLADPDKSSDRVTYGYIIWRANRVKNAVHSPVNDSVSPVDPSPVMIPLEIELLK